MNKCKNNDNNKNIVGQCSAAANMCADNRINTDPNGSWTGVVPDNPNEVPVQDVDDL